MRAYTGAATRYLVSTAGGAFPKWSHNGEEFFFLRGESLWSARVRMSPAFLTDAPQKLFDFPDDVWSRMYDASPDGQSFVTVRKDPLELRPLDLVAIPGWTEEMKSRLATR